MIVSKEIARKLRDIGFREPTDYQFNHYGGLIRNDYALTGNQIASDKGYGNCDAPDKSDVFAWFRKKGIIGEVGWSDYGFYYWLISTSPEFTHPGYETWKEAEDACIEKMIELCTA